MYREINTGEIDSTYAGLHPALKGKISRFEKPPGAGGGIYEITRLENRGVKYFLRGKEHTGHWYLGDDPPTDVEFDMSIFMLTKVGENAGGITAEKYHSQPWEIVDIVDEDYYTTFHDSVQFRDKMYKNVVQVQIAPDWEAAAWIYQSYFVKDIRVVYREFYDGTAWELVRYGSL